MVSAKNIRVSILLLLLFTLSFFAIRDLFPIWEDKTIVVNIHLANPRGSEEVNNFIKKMKPDHFKDVETFLTENAKNYSKKDIRFNFIIRGEVKNKLPTGFFEKTIASDDPFSLWLYDIKEIMKLRYYVLKNRWGSDASRSYDVYANYYRFDDEDVPANSLAFQVGTFAVLNLHAEKSMIPYDALITAHEVLHLFGAKDRYDQSLNPIFPMGYAEPNKEPRYPQKKAEIMGGYIPLNKEDSIAATLDEAVLNPITAKEVRWLEPLRVF